MYQGSVLRELDRHTEALIQFKLALGLDPESVAALNNLWLTYQRMGNLGEALRIYTRSLEINSRQDNIENIINEILKLNEPTN